MGRVGRTGLFLRMPLQAGRVFLNFPRGDRHRSFFYRQKIGGWSYTYKVLGLTKQSCNSQDILARL